MNGESRQNYARAHAIPCPACGAGPGRFCKRPSGHSGPAVTPHAARRNAAGVELGPVECHDCLTAWAVDPVFTVGCPHCHASAGEPCNGTPWHPARDLAADDAGAYAHHCTPAAEARREDARRKRAATVPHLGDGGTLWDAPATKAPNDTRDADGLAELGQGSLFAVGTLPPRIDSKTQQTRLEL